MSHVVLEDVRLRDTARNIHEEGTDEYLKKQISDDSELVDLRVISLFVVSLV